MHIEQPSGVLPSDQIYFFLHIAKTAGSTFVNILNNFFPQNEICPAYYTLDLREIPPENLDSYKFFRGHINYYALCSLLNKKPNTLVFLRNPYDLAISIHSHIRRKDDRDFLDTDIKNLRRLTLRDYIFNPGQILSLDYANLQIRALTAKVRLENIGANDGYFEDDFDGPTLDNPAYARKLLREFMFLGLAERFEESMLLLAYTLGVRPILRIPSLNVGDNKPKSEQLSPQIYEKITQYSALDLEMHNFAQQLFDERLTLMSQDLLEKYAAPEQARMKLPLAKEVLYELLEKHYQATFRERHRLVNSIEYSFDQPLTGNSWYDPEVNGDHGIYRWSGPATVSTLDFPLAATDDLKIKFEVLLGITPAVLDSLLLEIEGQVIPLTTRLDPSGIIIYEGIIPAALIARTNGLTRLTFKVGETVTPNAIYQDNQDRRRLGFALRNVIIHPCD